MNGLTLTPPTQAVVDHLLSFAAKHPTVEVEITPIAPGGSHEVFVDLLPAALDQCNLSLRLREGWAEALFASKDRIAALHKTAPSSSKDSCFLLDMRRDYKHLAVLLNAVAAGRVRPYSAVWFGRALEPLGAYVGLDEKEVYVGETSGFIRGILALPRIVTFREASFAPWA